MKKIRILATALLASTMPFAMTACGQNVQPTEQENGGTEEDPNAGKVVTAVSITGGSEVYEGKTLQLTATVSGAKLDESDKTNVVWSSDATDVATVSASGLVTGLKPGTAKITATSALNDQKSKTVTITVLKFGWSEKDEKLMDDCFGVQVPFFNAPAGAKWVDYFSKYRCISLETTTNTVDEMKTALEAANFTSTGSDTDYGFETHHFSVEASDGGIFTLDLYYYNGTSLDVYCPVYNFWPEERINKGLTQIGLTVENAIPGFTNTTGMEFDVLTTKATFDGVNFIDVVWITASGEYLLASDYADLLPEDKYFIYQVGNSFDCGAKDKSHSMYVQNDSSADDTIDIIIYEYQPDEWIEIDQANTTLELEETLQLTVSQGHDAPAGTIEFTSDNTDAVTVDASGLCTAVGEGEATITATLGELEDTIKITVAALPEEFTDSQIAEFKKLHDSNDVVIPFNKYIKNVVFDTETETVNVTGLDISEEEFVTYFNAFVTAGWTDSYGCAKMAQQYETDLINVLDVVVDQAGSIEFEKDIVINEDTFTIRANVFCLDDNEEPATSGSLCVELSDPYFYTYAEGKAAFEGQLQDLDIVIDSFLPETLAGTKFEVLSDASEAQVGIYAYGVEGEDATIAAGLVSDFATTGITLTLAKSGTYYVGYADTEAGVLTINMQVSNGMIMIVVYETTAEGIICDILEKFFLDEDEEPELDVNYRYDATYDEYWFAYYMTSVEACSAYTSYMQQAFGFVLAQEPTKNKYGGYDAYLLTPDYNFVITIKTISKETAGTQYDLLYVYVFRNVA